MKLKGMLVVSLLLTLFFTVQAEDYTYTESAHKIYITGYTGAGGAVNIPDTINGFPVTLIDSSAFAGNTNITSVTIGTNVTTIGWYAFNDCSVLTNVTISRSVTSILGEAFSHCQSLRVILVDDNNSSYSSTNGVLLNKSKTMLIQCPGGKTGSFTIPDGVTNVEKRAFAKCSITNVIIGGGVTSIGDEAFESSTNLTRITIGDSVTSVGVSAFMYCYSLTNAVIGNGVTNLGARALYQCSNLTSVTIGTNVTSVGASTFYSCSNLKIVTIPDSATAIGAEAFSRCTGLTGVTIGNNITNIGSSAFLTCTSLTSITIPDSVTLIGNSAFCFCTSAVSAVIGNGVTSIGDDTFSSCESLTNVVIGSRVASIGEYAFDCCKSLTSVTIPNSVASIGYSAFGSCSSLTDIKIGTNVTSIGEGAFWGCAGLTDVTIPDSVRFIGRSAFYFCTKLTSAMIGAGVTNIGLSAFGYCTNLTGVYFQGNAPAVSSNLFGAASSLPVVYRRSGASGWPTVPTPWSGRPTALWDPGASYLLTVNGGTGSGSYTNLQRVTITANDPAGGKAFDRWTGAVQYVANVASSTTTVTMPAQNITLAATYKDTYHKFALTVTGGTGSGSYTSGQKVTITATVPAGMKFDRWSGATQCLASVTSSPTVVTMPPSEAIVVATFKDIQKPVLTINSPANGLRTNNALLTVTGKATDNSGSVNVLIQLNDSSWTTNNVSLSTTNWTANLTLLPGSNSVKVCARDAIGNNSLTSSVSCTYVVPGNLTIQTNGAGTVTRTPNEKPEINKTYTLTAAAGPGSIFSNWIGVVSNPTNKVTTFVMTSNMTISANFADVAKPTVAIKTPTALQKIFGTNGSFTVTGTASDNLTLSNVMVKINGGSFAPANTTTNGLKSWVLPVTLTPGITNIIAAYSVDATGNCSVTVTTKCIYVETGTLIIQTNGVGTVTRAPTDVPEVGKTYTLTAAAGPGSIFSNWIGVVSNPTNKVTTFVMTSNMTISANFTDTAKPTVAITAPAALQKVYGTTGDFTVRGTAADNLALSNVMVKVNSGSFVPASPASTSGLKSWTLPVTLILGTNTIYAQSIDTTGNCSVTVTTKCVYVETGTLNITTNGPGKVTVAPTGALELNKTYTLTAAANAGGVFSNWTGDVVIGSPTGKVVKVTLNATNKTVAVAANFTDIAKPTVTITLPTANLRITNTNPVYTVNGTATDNSAVATVKVQLNSGAWTNAATTNAWKNWSAPVTLITGTNTIRAYSIDTAGNNSSTASVACIYPVVTIDVAAYANLSVGGRWNYKQTEGADISTRALEVIEATIKNGHPIYLLQEYSAGGYPDDQFFWSSDFSAGLFDTGGLNDNGEPTETTFYWQPFMPKLFKTFVPGTETTTKCTRSDMTGFITSKGKTVRERVTVPAGTYDCWKVSGTATFNGQISSDTSWYAENVGLVKRLQDGSLWELTSYVPPASSDPMGIPSSGQDVVLAPTPQVAIVADGISKDWTDVPRSTFSYSSVTQEVAVALSGNNIALLLSGCPFGTSDTVLVYFKLRLTYGTTDNRHTVDLWTSGSVLYGMVDGQAITGLEAVLLNGVLEVKIPIEQVPSQVTIEEVGCGMDPGSGTMTELFRFAQP